MLFDNSPDEIVYNKTKYQKEANGVNDCGRWCVLRTLKMLKGMDLKQFHDFIKEEEKRRGLTADQTVTSLVPWV